MKTSDRYEYMEIHDSVLFEVAKNALKLLAYHSPSPQKAVLLQTPGKVQHTKERLCGQLTR